MASGTRLKRRAVILVAAGLIVAFAGITGVFFTTFPGVTIQRVGFSTAAYESPSHRVSGLLLRPDHPIASPTPAVVLCHGFLMSKEVYLGVARELARKGIVVLAIDLRGHGGTGGSNDQGYSEMFDAWAAIDYLEGTRGVDGNRIAVAGHSRGGNTAARAGIFRSRDDIRAVASVYCSTSVEESIVHQFGPIDDFIGRLWPRMAMSHAFDVNSPSDLKKREFAEGFTATRPPNFLLVIGSKDELVTLAEERRIIQSATGRASVVAGVRYGDFGDGTARELVVTRDNHLGEAVSPAVWTAVGDWLFEAFGLKRPSPAGRAPAARLLSYGLVLLGFLTVSVGAAETGWYLFRERASRWGPTAMPGGRSRAMPAVCILIYLAASVAALPLMGALHIGALVPFSFLPLLLGTDVMTSIAAGQTMVLLAAFPFMVLLARRLGAVPAGWPGRAAPVPGREAGDEGTWTDDRAGGTEPVPLDKGVAAKAFMALAPFALFVLLYAPVAYALHITRGVPITISGFFSLAGVLAVYFFVSGHLFHGFLMPVFGDMDGMRKRAAYVLTEAAVRGLGFGLAFAAVAANPFIRVRLLTGVALPLVPTMALIGFLIFIPVSALILALRRGGFGVSAPSVMLALFIAWVFSTQVAVRFF
jgi:acetyl esterase/lipase